MKAEGLVVALAVALEQPHNFRYRLLDDTGSEVSDENENHIILKEDVEGEWTRKDSSILEYQRDSLAFGPASSSWGTVEQMRVDVEGPNGFKSMGAVELGSGGVSVASGDFLILDPDSIDITIDYSAASDTLNNFPTTNDGFMENVVSVANSKIPKWKFELVPAGTSDYSSTITEKGSNIDWNHNNSQLEYNGPDFEWKKNHKASFDVDIIRVVMVTPQNQAIPFGEVSISNTTVSKGDTPKITSSDSMTLKV